MTCSTARSCLRLPMSAGLIVSTPACLCFVRRTTHMRLCFSLRSPPAALMVHATDLRINIPDSRLNKPMHGYRSPPKIGTTRWRPVHIHKQWIIVGYVLNGFQPSQICIALQPINQSLSRNLECGMLMQIVPQMLSCFRHQIACITMWGEGVRGCGQKYHS